MNLLRPGATEIIRRLLHPVICLPRYVEMSGRSQAKHPVVMLILGSSTAGPTRSDWNLSGSPEGS